MKRKLAAVWLLLGLCMGMFPASASALENYPNLHTITLSSTMLENGTYSHLAIVDGMEAEAYDYTWHADPSNIHSDVKDSPAEFYSGIKPDTDAPVYIAHDIFYYPQMDENSFTSY